MEFKEKLKPKKSLSYLAAIYPGQLMLDTSPKKAKEANKKKYSHLSLYVGCLKLKFQNLAYTNIHCKNTQ